MLAHGRARRFLAVVAQHRPQQFLQTAFLSAQRGLLLEMMRQQQTRRHSLLLRGHALGQEGGELLLEGRRRRPHGVGRGGRGLVVARRGLHRACCSSQLATAIGRGSGGGGFAGLGVLEDEEVFEPVHLLLLLLQMRLEQPLLHAQLVGQALDGQGLGIQLLALDVVRFLEFLGLLLVRHLFLVQLLHNEDLVGLVVAQLLREEVHLLDQRLLVVGDRPQLLLLPLEQLHLLLELLLLRSELVLQGELLLGRGRGRRGGR